ncbi:hypothetical protein [Nocardioides nitrophenolicus]|uniref:hypothetical protein n=1 Tax=Nocardioides nitrophenolicus TaxID=60489 RepID=UPI001956AE95|nr:hypothetical protein [Nocardioides nitrophenolicus]MBM7517106.1 hypothetical protein [Nocardioides nitrophenolicus]
MSPVTLTVYARADLAVCSRVLQTLTVRQYAVARLVADLDAFDHREVPGLERVPGPVMRIGVELAGTHESDLDRAHRLLDRILDVYRVERTVPARASETLPAHHH